MRRTGWFLLIGVVLFGGLVQQGWTQETLKKQEKARRAYKKEMEAKKEVLLAEESRRERARDRMATLAAQHEQDVLELVDKIAPEESAWLRTLKERAPAQEAYQKRIVGIWERTQRFKRWARREPERYQEELKRFGQELKIGRLEHQSKELGMAYRNAAGEDSRLEVRSQLRALTADLFELRETRREEEVKRMEQELSRLKKTLFERKRNREEIIDRRVSDLVGEGDTLKW